MPASQQLLDLAGHYRDKQVEFPGLKGVTLASWILESGWGQSELARKHNNFAGDEDRSEIKKFAKKVRYRRMTGRTTMRLRQPLCFLTALGLPRRAPYKGWRAWRRPAGSAPGAEGFADGAYAGKELSLLGRRCLEDVRGVVSARRARSTWR